MDVLLVRDLVLTKRPERPERKKWIYRGVVPEPPPLPDVVLKTARLYKEVDLPFPPCDGMVLQDEHMCMQVNGLSYDLKDKALLVRLKSEVLREEDDANFDSTLSCYAALGWSLFPKEEDSK